MIPILFVAHGRAAPHLPADLAEWNDWVLTQNPTAACINRLPQNCSWSGRLTLNVHADEGRFLLTGVNDADMWVDLPGSSGLWPVNVQLNGKHVPVMNEGDTPRINVPLGEFRIEGTIVWNNIPKELPLPKSVGILQVQQGDTDIAVQLDGQGQLLLNQQDSNSESIPIITTSRLWEDGPTPTLTTHISIQNSGLGQITQLGSIQLQDGILVDLHSSINSWIDSSGNLVAYIPSGTHTLSYTHALPANIEEIPTPTTPTNWPITEEWTIHTDHHIRQLSFEGLQPIDQSISAVPSSWKQHPTYTKDSTSTVSFQTVLRGNPNPPPNTLSLSRTLWPKLTGEGFWIQDEISGTMTQEWFLQPPPNLAIQSIEHNGFAQSIVESSDGVNTIPVRTQEVSTTIIAESTESTPTFYPWNIDFSYVTMTMVVPPSSLLLYWNGMVWSNIWGAVLNLLLSLGWWRRSKADVLTGLLLVTGSALGGLIAPVSTLLLTLFYWIGQWKSLRTSMFILSICWGGLALYESQNHRSSQETTSIMHAEDYQLNQSSLVGTRSKRHFYTRNNAQTIQLGMGLPTWNGERHTQYWADGQPSASTLPFWVLNQNHKRWVAIFAGLLLTLLGWRETDSNTRQSNEHTATTKTLGALLLLSVLSGSHTAMADAPSPSVQTDSHAIVDTQIPPAQLEALILDHHFPTECDTECANIALAKLTVDNMDTLNIWMEVHASAPTVVTLPGPLSQWNIQNVQQEGSNVQALRRSDNNFLEVKLAPGVWSVVASGPLTAGTQLEWPQQPHRIDVQADDWMVQGILENGQITGQTLFTPISKNQDPSNSIHPNGLIEWTQHLNIDKTVIVTHTIRRSPEQAKHALYIPLSLQEGERVLSPHVQQIDGVWTAHLDRSISTLEWQTQLPISTEFQLEFLPPKDIAVAQTWVVECSMLQQCTFEGPPVTHHAEEGKWRPTWHPHPGEVLTIHTESLTSITGDTTQIKDVNIRHKLGNNWIQSSADIHTVSSVRGLFSIQMPEDAIVQSLLVNGEQYPFKPTSELTLLNQIGDNNIRLSWKSPRQKRLLAIQNPAFALTSSNSTLSIETEPDDTVLWASMPWPTTHIPWWIKLVLVLLLGLSLARHPKSTLPFGAWVFTLLGITLSGPTGIALFVPLIVCWHLTDTRWQWLLGLVITGALAVFSMALLIRPTLPIWLWNRDHLTWYMDATSNIPSPTVLTVPSHWTLWLWLCWTAWMLYKTWPTLIERVRTFRSTNDSESNLEQST